MEILESDNCAITLLLLNEFEMDHYFRTAYYDGRSLVDYFIFLGSLDLEHYASGGLKIYQSPEGHFSSLMYNVFHFQSKSSSENSFQCNFHSLTHKYDLKGRRKFQQKALWRHFSRSNQIYGNIKLKGRHVIDLTGFNIRGM